MTLNKSGRLLLVTLVFVLLFSFIGCGNGPEDGVSSNDEEEKVKPEDGEEAVDREYWADLRMVQGFNALFRVFVEDTNVPEGALFSVEDGDWESADTIIGDGSMVERFFMEDSFTLIIKNSAGEMIQSRRIELPAEDFEERVTLEP